MMKRRWIPIIVLLGTTVSLLAPGANAQNEPSSLQNPQPCPLKSEESNPPKADPALRDDCLITPGYLNSFRPTIAGRFARGFQYTYEVGEQPQSVVVGSGSTTQIVQNPEHYLNQHSLSFQFGELFLSSSDLSNIVKQISADLGNSDWHVKLDDKICGTLDVISCLASGGRAWRRALSGLSVKGSLSERQGFQQGVIVLNPSFKQHYGLAGEIDFDPQALFITATHWKTAIDDVKNLNIDLGPAEGDCFDKEKVGKSRDECRSSYNTPRVLSSKPPGRLTQLAEAFIPKFQFKRMSQFDFVKSGGVLISSPFPESALNNYTFTWDLKRLIVDSKTRVDADAIYEGYKRPASGQQQLAKICVSISETTKSYINVPTKFSAVNCGKLASQMEAVEYQLACASDTQVLLGKRISKRTEPTDEDKPKSNPCGW